MNLNFLWMENTWVLLVCVSKPGLCCKACHCQLLIRGLASFQLAMQYFRSIQLFNCTSLLQSFPLLCTFLCFLNTTWFGFHCALFPHFLYPCHGSIVLWCPFLVLQMSTFQHSYFNLFGPIEILFYFVSTTLPSLFLSQLQMARQHLSLSKEAKCICITAQHGLLL